MRVIRVIDDRSQICSDWFSAEVSFVQRGSQVLVTVLYTSAGKQEDQKGKFGESLMADLPIRSVSVERNQSIENL